MAFVRQGRARVRASLYSRPPTACACVRRVGGTRGGWTRGVKKHLECPRGREVELEPGGPGDESDRRLSFWRGGWLLLEA
jgi:hypothetical protein